MVGQGILGEVDPTDLPTFTVEVDDPDPTALEPGAGQRTEHAGGGRLIGGGGHGSSLRRGPSSTASCTPARTVPARLSAP